ncbi:MAG: HAD domain-containing protein [Solirubrobacteraceae bacterium]
MLLLDVDGVISLFGFDLLRPPAGHYALVDGTMHFLSATAAALIEELAPAFELVWCTGWEEKADEQLPARLGLPRGLAHLTFVTAATESATAEMPPRHWKLEAIDTFAGPRRPLAWIDDAHDDSCRQWAAQRAGPTLLVVTDPTVGITTAHARELDAWAASLTD